MRDDTHILGSRDSEKEVSRQQQRQKKRWHLHSAKWERGQQVVNKTNKEATHPLGRDRERVVSRQTTGQTKRSTHCNILKNRDRKKKINS